MLTLALPDPIVEGIGNVHSAIVIYAYPGGIVQTGCKGGRVLTGIALHAVSGHGFDSAGRPFPFPDEMIRRISDIEVPVRIHRNPVWARDALGVATWLKVKLFSIARDGFDKAGGMCHSSNSEGKGIGDVNVPLEVHR